MAKNRPSFGDSVSKGMNSSYQKEPVSSDKKTASETSETGNPAGAGKKIDAPSGLNPYYDYHPKTGKRGGVIGAPRATIKRTQISIGCTENEKALYKNAAAADGRKLSDFVYHAVIEYITNHNLDV